MLQVRAFAESSLQTLIKSGASSEGPPPTQRDFKAEQLGSLAVLQTHLPSNLANPSASSPNRPPTVKFSLLQNSLEFQASLVADLVYARKFIDGKAWQRCIGVYMGPWLTPEGGAAYAESVRSHFDAIDKVRCISLDFSVDGGIHRFPSRNTKSSRVAHPKRANSSVIRCSLWLMAHYYYSLIQPFA